MPVQASTTSAISCGPDLLADHRVLDRSRPLGGLDLLLQRRGSGRRGSPRRHRGRPRAAGARPRTRSSSICLRSVAGALERGLLALPADLEPAQLLLPVGEVGAQPLEAVLGGLVGLALERELLHLHPVHGATELVDLDRRALDLHPQPRGRLVDEVDRLVGQLAAADVAVGEHRRGHERGVGDLHAVVRLVLLLQPAQDRDGVLDARLADEDLLEAALERGVLLDPLAVLVQRGRTDQVQLAAGEHRLEHVAGVHRGVAAGARADDRVQLVDEGDDLALGALDLLEHGLEPLLELAAVLRAGDHRGQVEAEHPLALERVGDVARDDALGEALDDRGLADAGLTDQHRVVLGTPRQHLDHPADLGVAPDDRVELALLGARGEVDGVLLERLVGRLGLLAGHLPVAADGRDRLAQRLSRRRRARRAAS